MRMRSFVASVQTILISAFAIAVAGKAPIDWPSPGTAVVAAHASAVIDWP